MERRVDLDWLRVLLFALLVLHHVAVGFIDIGADIYGVVNNDLGGPLLNLFVYFSQSWRLPLLFLISGIGTWFATRHVVGIRPLAGRVARLMVPALFGTFVLNVTYGYTLASATGDAPGSFLTFWAAWLLDPEPRQVGHLWFLYNLTLYTLILWPFRFLLDRWQPAPSSVPRVLGTMAVGATLITLVLKPYLSAIAGDGYQFAWYLWIFASGYVIGAHHHNILAWLAKRAYWLMAAGVVCFAAEVVMLAMEIDASPAGGLAMAQGGWASDGFAPAFHPGHVLFTAISGINTWLWCLAFLGLAARYLQFDRPALRFLGPAVFPVYVLHFPITLVGLALIAELAWPWPVKFLLLAVSVYGLSIAIYLGVRRMGRVVYLIGGKALRM
ncbi:acyltransferase family protein [Halomonas tibetensis]|uniref:Acyltransferase family protein n=1 Tax=Halomonas tibetensis TaxID=2259590 RepID=A0ABV7B662_9GAMM